MLSVFEAVITFSAYFLFDYSTRRHVIVDILTLTLSCVVFFYSFSTPSVPLVYCLEFYVRQKMISKFIKLICIRISKEVCKTCNDQRREKEREAFAFNSSKWTQLFPEVKCYGFVLMHWSVSWHTVTRSLELYANF